MASNEPSYCIADIYSIPQSGFDFVLVHAAHRHLGLEFHHLVLKNKVLVVLSVQH